MARKTSKKNFDLMPLGLIGGADEFEEFYPAEMSRLGALTAYWSLVEDSLCNTLAALLADNKKARAAFYSTTNHKARRDMVAAVAKCTQVSVKGKAYLNAALEATKEAADARNHLLHGLFKMEIYSGELMTVHTRPASKVPEFTRRNVMAHINAAIEKCEIAANLLSSAALTVRWPDFAEFEGVMKQAAAERKKERSE